MLGDWPRRQPGPPTEPRCGGPRPEARRHQGGDTGALLGGSPEAPRVDIDTGALAKLRDRSAALGDAGQLRAGDRAVGGCGGTATSGKGSRRWLRLHEKSGEAARLSRPTTGRRRTRRLGRRCRARGADGGALPVDAGSAHACPDRQLSNLGPYIVVVDDPSRIRQSEASVDTYLSNRGTLLQATGSTRAARACAAHHGAREALRPGRRPP